MKTEAAVELEIDGGPTIRAAAVPGAFAFSNTPGLSADSGHILLLSEDIDSIKFDVSTPFFSKASGSKARSSGEAAGQDALSGSLGIRCKIHLYGDEKQTLENIYIKEDGIEEELVNYGEGPSLVRLEFADVRYFWGKRGITPELTCNWPKLGYRDPKKTVVRKGQRTNSDYYWKSTLNPRTKEPFLLLEVIRDYICPFLPGDPLLGHFPKKLRKRLAPFLDWPGKTPIARDALAALLKLFNLTPTYDVFLNRLDLYEPDDGRLGRGEENKGSIESHYFIEAPKSRSFSFPVEAVEITGPPRLKETIVRLEPVGPFNPDTQSPKDPAPLSDWLQEHFGLSLLEAGGLILQDARVTEEILRKKAPKMNRGQKKAAQEAQKRAEAELGTKRLYKFFKQFAFRMYQIPKDKAPDLLPVERRVKVYPSGFYRLNVEIYSEGVTEVIEDRPDADGGKSGGGSGRPQTGVGSRPRLNTDALGTGSFQGASPGGTRARNGSRGNSQGSGAAGSGKNHRFINIAMVFVGGYKLDPDTGIVHFDIPQGTLQDTRDIVSITQTNLVPAKVDMIFAYRDRTPLDDDPEDDDQKKERRFTYRAVWTKDGAKEVKKFPKGVKPTPVYRDDLQLVEELDGATNEENLIEAAKEIADAILNAGEERKGTAPLLNTFVDVRCDGKVKGVRWACDGRVAFTFVQEGAGFRGPGLTMRRALHAVYDAGAVPFGVSPGYFDKQLWERSFADALETSRREAKDSRMHTDSRGK